MKYRRGVGGLISLIGILAVFGVATTAFIELNSMQTSLINQSVEVNNKVTDRNKEQLNFTDVSVGNPTIMVDNLWSKSSAINSYLLIASDKSIQDSGYLNTEVRAGEADISITIGAAPSAGDKIVLLTDQGNKCLVQVDRSFGVC